METRGVFCYNIIMQSATKKRIGILRGGTGEHYTKSLQKGGEIISYITDNLGNKFQVFDIFVDKDHVWHFKGIPVSPSDLVNKVDVVWNTSHPSFSNILNSLSIPNIGTGFFSSALENSREMLKEHISKIGIIMPRHIVLPVYKEDIDGPIELYAVQKAKEIHGKFPAPWIVKSFAPNSNMAIHLAKTFPELVSAIEDGVKNGTSILIEEFITGKVASVHSVPGFRGEDIYTFPLGNSFGIFSGEEKEKLASLVKDLHKHIDAKHYLKSDFVVSPRGRVFLLQIETSPDLKTNSHFSQVCEMVGAEMHHVVEHILNSAII